MAGAPVTRPDRRPRHINLDESLWDRLRERAEREGLSIADVANAALDEGLAAQAKRQTRQTA